MLPEALSNELCSLNPNTDKLTFSAVFTFDTQYNIKSSWFGKTVIHSNHRFAYEEVQDILESGKGKFSDELNVLNKIAKKLRDKKFKEGAIAFETEEVQFKLDENGVPIEVYTKQRKEAHMLIEDFMLLANKEVAKYIAKKGKGREIPFVYRIHDLPDIDRVKEFALIAKELGFNFDFNTPKTIAKSFNAFVKAAENDAAMRLVEPLAIRTMAKAIYATDNIGHYGLAFEYYTHFTSPIRRYADMLVHRILEKNLGNTWYMDKKQLDVNCKYISEQEKKAQQAERESIKYKQVEFLETHIGEVFKGNISGFIEKGFFVQLEGSHAEGLITFEKLGDHFIQHGSPYRWKGRHSGRLLTMGDEITVRLIDTDLEARQIDLEEVEEEVS
jgi:ribonuclease R